MLCQMATCLVALQLECKWSATAMQHASERDDTDNTEHGDLQAGCHEIQA